MMFAIPERWNMRYSFLPLLPVLTVATGLLLGSTDTLAEELTQGAMLSNSCAGCHGTDGNSPGSIPTIGGKSADFIAGSLRDFRDNKRGSTVMNRHASAYSDEEIQLIAEFFSSRK